MNSIDFFHPLFSWRCSYTPRRALLCSFLQRHPQKKRSFSYLSALRGKSTWNDGALGPFLPYILDAGTMICSAYSVSEGGKNWQIAVLDVIFLRMAEGWSRVYILVEAHSQGPRHDLRTIGASHAPAAAGLAPRAARWPPARAGKAFPGIASSPPDGRIAVREPFASLQRRLLESEGVRLVNGHVPLAEHLWAPPKRSPKRSIKVPSKRPSKRASKKPSK